MVVASRLLSPYRAVGYITDGAPFAVNRLGEATFFTTTIGNAFQVFESEKLRLSLVSPPLIEGGRVVGIATHGSNTFIATERAIQVWNRVTLKGSLSPSHPGRITALLLVGDALFTLCDQGKLRVWNAKSREMTKEIEVEVDTKMGRALILHPDTYINKVLISDSASRLTLWNIRSGQLIHDFQSIPKGRHTSITALQQSPALDVVAVGYSDGQIVLVNLRFDKVLFTLSQDRVPVTSLSFRTDSQTEVLPMLASAGEDGQIHLWDLKEKKLHSVIKAAHESRVSSLYFLPREPLLVSSGVDNSLKMWIFDAADGSARLLKSREGHTAPPRRIRYYGNVTMASMGEGADATGCQILSAGSDRSLRVFNTARDSQSREMSQGPLLKRARKLQVRLEDLRLRPIVGFSAVETRSRDWCNVITCHESDPNTYVWKFDQRAIGQAVLRQPEWPNNSLMALDDPKHHALCVTISTCGNYGLVGTRGGVIYKYNMQSGQPRGRYPKVDVAVKVVGNKARSQPGSVWSAYKAISGEEPKVVRRPALTENEEGKGGELTPTDHGHQGAVTGIQVDSLNNVVVSGGLDGYLRFWEFGTHELVDKVEVGVGVSMLELAKDNDLLAVACDDFVVRVYDITTRKLVRRLVGHTTHLSDLCFSSDGRRIVTASPDGDLRVWDLATGACIDWIRSKKAVTGVSWSPTGEFLCTSHADRLGLHLWVDRSLYQSVLVDKEPEEPVEVDEPSPLVEVDQQQQEEEEQGDEAMVPLTASAVTAADDNQGESTSGPVEWTPMKEGLVTLSLLPRAHWQTLFQLELIKLRNKPAEPPKAPPRAPFFLPTVHLDGATPSFVPAPPQESPSAAPTSTTAPTTNTDDAHPMMSQVWSDDDDDEGKEEAPVALGSRVLVTSARNAEKLPTGSRIIKGHQGGLGKPARSKLATVLSSSVDAGQLSDVTNYLKGLTPPQIDLEMQALCLGAFDEEGVELLGHSMAYFTHEVEHRKNFEVVQAYLNRFLKIYSGILMDDPKLSQAALKLHQLEVQANRRVKELTQQTLCLLNFFANLQGF